MHPRLKADSPLLAGWLGTPARTHAGSPPPCRLDCLPTDVQLMDALRANGYAPGGAAGGGSRQQQGGAAAAAAARPGRGSKAPQQQQQQQRDAEEEGLEGVVRIQAVKLVLRTAVALCRYCRKVGGLSCGGRAARKH